MTDWNASAKAGSSSESTAYLCSSFPVCVAGCNAQCFSNGCGHGNVCRV
jgi:hypothetical protein